jgi:glycosyltransferase involved in cell wall biosynthesis
MKVSVILPTYQGRNKLPLILSAIEKQRFRNFELIVVVDGSTDGSLDFLAAHHNKSLRVISQKNKGRSGARNAGAGEAVGELLVFYDDDMEPDADSLLRHVDFHSRGEEAVLGGNQVEYESQAKSDLQNYKAWVSHRWTLKHKPGIQQMFAGNLFFTAANCSIRKNTFERLGGFNEMLTDAEDFDLALRCIEQRIPVYLDKDNIAIHHDPITWPKYLRRIGQYKAANRELEILHPRLMPKAQADSNFIKNWIYRFLSISKIPGILERSSIVKLLPKTIRYRLYSAVIHAQTR